MSLELPDWTPEEVIDLGHRWRYSRGDYHDHYRFVSNEHHRTADGANASLIFSSLTDGEECLDPYSINLRHYEISDMSDQEIVSLVRGAHWLMRIKSHYSQIRSFLIRPSYYSHPLWTMDLLRDHFRLAYQAAEEMAGQGSPEWALALQLFQPYWDCEHAEGGYVYCLHDQQGHYKIGMSKKLDRRIRQLRTQPPFELSLEFAFKVLYAQKYEAYLHHQYRARRLNGEWFSLTPDDLETIKRKAGLSDSEDESQVEVSPLGQ